jgi:hypothetical protein
LLSACASDPFQERQRLRERYAGYTDRELRTMEREARTSFESAPIIPWQGWVTVSTLMARDGLRQTAGDLTRELSRRSEARNKRIATIEGVGGPEVRDTEVDALAISAASPFEAALVARVQVASRSTRGAGLVVGSQGLIATTAQLAEDERRLTVRFLDGWSGRARVAFCDPTSGVALLEVDRQDLPSAYLGFPREGRTAISIGGVSTEDVDQHHGLIATTRAMPSGRITLAMEDPGPSLPGTPLADSASGLVVGMLLRSRRVDGTTLAEAVSSTAIQTALHLYSQGMKDARRRTASTTRFDPSGSFSCRASLVSRDGRCSDEAANQAQWTVDVSYDPASGEITVSGPGSEDLRGILLDRTAFVSRSTLWGGTTAVLSFSKDGGDLSAVRVEFRDDECVAIYRDSGRRLQGVRR